MFARKFRLSMLPSFDVKADTSWTFLDLVKGLAADCQEASIPLSWSGITMVGAPRVFREAGGTVNA